LDNSRKFISAKASDNTIFSYRFGETLCRFDQDYVTGVMAEHVVYLLKIVEIYHDKGEWRARLSGVNDVSVEFFFQRGSIEQPGQPVVIGDLAKLFFPVFLRGNITRDNEDCIMSVNTR
jgi:hypothetical protein